MTTEKWPGMLSHGENDHVTERPWKSCPKVVRGKAPYGKNRACTSMDIEYLIREKFATETGHEKKSVLGFSLKS